MELANRLQQKEVARRCAEWISNKVEIRSIREANQFTGRCGKLVDASKAMKSNNDFD